MTREKIIEKIRKLFELANHHGGNEAESVSAALKAQELISEYDITEDELSANPEREEVVEVISATSKPRPWNKLLARVVADNFRCRYFENVSWNFVTNLSTGRKTKRCNGRQVVFMGYELDANAAVITYEHLYKTGDRLARAESRRVKKERGYQDGVYNTFVLGFVEGVRGELEKQCRALMLVTPLEVKDAYKAKFENNIYDGPASRNMKFGKFIAEDAREKGQAEGARAVRASRMGKAETLAIGR